MSIKLKNGRDVMALAPAAGDIKRRMEMFNAGQDWRVGAGDWFNVARFPIVGAQNFGATVICSLRPIESPMMEAYVGMTYSTTAGVNRDILVSAAGIQVTPAHLSAIAGLLTLPQCHITIIQHRDQEPVKVTGDSWMLAVFAACAGWPPMYYTGTGLNRSAGLFVIETADDIQAKLDWVNSQGAILVIAADPAAVLAHSYTMIDLLAGREFTFSPAVIAPTIGQIILLVTAAAFSASKSTELKSRRTAEIKNAQAEHLDTLTPDEFLEQCGASHITIDYLDKFSRITPAQAASLGMSLNPPAMAEHALQMIHGGVPRDETKFKGWVSSMKALEKKIDNKDKPVAPQVSKTKFTNLFAIGGPKPTVLSKELDVKPKAKRAFTGPAPHVKVPVPTRQKVPSLAAMIARQRQVEAQHAQAPAAMDAGPEDYNPADYDEVN